MSSSRCGKILCYLRVSHFAHIFGFIQSFFFFINISSQSSHFEFPRVVRCALCFISHFLKIFTNIILSSVFRWRCDLKWFVNKTWIAKVRSKFNVQHVYAQHIAHFLYRVEFMENYLIRWKWPHKNDIFYSKKRKTIDFSHNNCRLSRFIPIHSKPIINFRVV